LRNDLPLELNIIILDFFVLASNFQEEQNLRNIFNPFCNPSLDSDTKIISSAYNRDVTVTSPTISGWVCPILRSFTRLLIYKMKLNKVGLRTSFCFTPQVDVKS
jgi:hypothetical protein